MSLHGSIGKVHEKLHEIGAKAGRPRKPETDAAILEAVLEVFAVFGYEGMSVEAVAAKSGVGKTTIYRRWPSKDDLIIAAIQDIMIAVEPEVTGDLRQNLVAMVSGALGFMKTSKAGLIFPRMCGEVAGQTPLGHRYVETVIGPRRKVVRDVLKRAIEVGELRSDIDVALMADLLVGPIIMRKILGELDQSPTNTAEQLVDSLLDGWKAK
jgi:AcrR family transcriptional regulator